MAREIESAIDAAVAENESAAKLPLKALVEDVTAELTPRLRRQHDELVRVLERFGDPKAADGAFPL